MESLGSGAAVLDLLFQIGSYRSILFDFGTDISTWTFEFYLKKNKGDRLKTLSLTLGSGLSFPVYESDQIQATFSSANTSIQEGQYYYELRRTDIALPLINGFAYFSFDAPQGTIDDTTLELTVLQQTITLAISNITTKESLGLDQVDNTSDIDKPVSTAQAAAILASGVIKSVTVNVPSISVLDLHLTNYDIIPAPGAGKYNRLLSISHILIFNGIQYIQTTIPSTPRVQFYYGNGRTFDCGFNTEGSFMVSTQSVTRTVIENAGLVNVNLSDLENKAITARTTSDSTFWTSGNGTYRVVATYMVIDI